MKSGPYVKESVYPNTAYYQAWSDNPPVKSWTLDTDYPFVINNSDSKEGMYNPDWRKQLGVVPINSAYDREVIEYTWSDGECNGTKTILYPSGFGWDIAYTGHVRVNGIINDRPYNSNLPSWLVYTSDLASADNRAKLSLASRIQEEYRKFQGGTFLNELRQTIKMIRQPSKKLFEMVGDYLTTARKRVRRVSPLRLSERSEILRDTYLEATLGWMPVIADIKDIAAAAGEMAVRGEKEYEGIRSIRSRPFGGESMAITEYSGQFPIPLPYGYIAFDEEARNLEQFTVQYTAQCDRKILYPKNELAALVTLSGFSLREWVPTLWNCIPYSFVFDYFTNIGDVVEFYSTDLSSVVGISKSVKRSQTQYMVWTLDPQATAALGGNVSWVGSDLGRLTRRRVSFTRTLVDPVTLDVRFETENPLPSPKKFFNLAALGSAIWHTNLNLRL